PRFRPRSPPGELILHATSNRHAKTEVTGKPSAATNWLTPPAGGQSGTERRRRVRQSPMNPLTLRSCDWHCPCTLVCGSEHLFLPKGEVHATDAKITKPSRPGGAP